MYIRKAFKNRKRLVVQSSKRSFRKIQIFKFAYSALPLFYSLFRVKSSLHRVVYTKRVKQSEEISCISLQSSRSSFRKIRIFKFAYSALPLFLFLGKVIEQRYRTVVTLDMFISVHDYSFRFVSFRFVSQNTVSQTNLSWKLH